MSTVSLTDLLAINRSGTTYKVTVGDVLRDRLPLAGGTLSGNLRFSGNADLVLPNNVPLNAALQARLPLSGGVMSGNLSFTNGADVVLDGGETLTHALGRYLPLSGGTLSGSLTLENTHWLKTNPLGGWSATAAADGNSWLYAHTAEPDPGVFTASFSASKNTWFHVNKQLVMDAEGVTIRNGPAAYEFRRNHVLLQPDGGRPFIFDADNFYTELPISVYAAKGEDNIRCLASTNDHAKIRFLTHDWVHETARIDARWTRTDYSGREQVWLRSAQVDPKGFVQLHGGSSSGTPVVVSMGSETHRIADMDSGGVWHVVSDVRSKRDVKPIHRGLDAVLELEPVAFSYVSDGSEEPTRLGFVAQDLQQVVPEAVKENADGQLSMAPDLLVPVLAAAVKELAQAVAELRQDVIALKEKPHA